VEDLSLHILDIAENSINAHAKQIEITLSDNEEGIMTLVISDDGSGMNSEFTSKVTDPFITTRTTRRVGMGIPFLKEAAHAAEGELRIESIPSVGSKITATFRKDHIDRKPLGNITETIVILIAGNPDVNFKYNHFINGNKFIFDTKEISEAFQDVPINSTQVLSFIRQYLTENINRKN